MKLRVYELAKEFGLEPKELIKKARAHKITLKSGLSTLDKATADTLRKALKTAPGLQVPKRKAALAKPVPKKAQAKEEKPQVEESVTTSLIDKAAAEEKSIRALRPLEIDQYTKEDSGRTKEKKRTLPRGKEIRIFEKLPKVKPKTKIVTQFGPVTLRKKAAPPERKIALTPPVTVKDVSGKLGIKSHLIIKKLMEHNIMASINDILDEDALVAVGLEFDYEIELKKDDDITEKVFKQAVEDRPEDLVPRPPVVVIMGHVDHGKTLLLDKIRSSNLVAQESGSITQHIGAYQVTVNNKKVVFLDTPGHEAFTQMRARGANVTDIALLVVAADDGVMPQTEEAINHARDAQLPILVVINKIDKKDANIHKVKQQLSGLDLIPEEWSGKTIFAEVSALTDTGIEHLLEMLILQAEMLELKANPKKKAMGTVLEAKLTEGKGVIATVLVQNGTLRIGDIIICGQIYGRVRAMFDDKFDQIKTAPPATPVGITGLPEVPKAGERFYVVENLQLAKKIAEACDRKKKEVAPTAPATHISLEGIFDQIEQNKIKEVKIILKADVKGSVEVLQNLLNNLSTEEEVKIKIIHSGVGRINESDVILADASDAIVLGFQVTPEERARSIAQERGVDIKLYTVIYQVSEEIKLALEGMLEPEKVEVITGHLNVKDVFKISRIGTIAGCIVTDGKVERSNLVRLKRDQKVIYEGKLSSLKRFKDDVREVAGGFECGLKIDGFDNIQVGDIIESCRIEERTRKLGQKTKSQQLEAKQRSASGGQ